MPNDPAEVDRARLERRYRDAAAFGTVGWTVRMAGRNLGWIRREGIGRLVEEHELDPRRRLRLALGRARWRHTHRGYREPATPVYLCGAPRSGTNMMVRGLSELPSVQTYNEGDRAAFRRYRLRADADVLTLVAASRQRVVLFKPLLDSHRLASLLDLPTAVAGRGIWAYRDVDGRARSALSKFGPSALIILREIAADRRSARWQAQGMSRATHDLLREVDWDATTPADAAALMWLVRNRLFFDLALDTRPEVMALSYDAVVADPDTALRAVCRHVGLPWTPPVSAAVDRRSAGSPPLDLSPWVRALCDDLGRRLDAAAARPIVPPA